MFTELTTFIQTVPLVCFHRGHSFSKVPYKFSVFKAPLCSDFRMLLTNSLFCIGLSSLVFEAQFIMSGRLYLSTWVRYVGMVQVFPHLATKRISVVHSCTPLTN